MARQCVFSSWVTECVQFVLVTCPAGTINWRRHNESLWHSFSQKPHPKTSQYKILKFVWLLIDYALLRMASVSYGVPEGVVQARYSKFIPGTLIVHAVPYLNQTFLSYKPTLALSVSTKWIFTVLYVDILFLSLLNIWKVVGSLSIDLYMLART